MTDRLLLPWRLVALPLLALLMLAVAFVSVPRVAANGTSVKVILTWMPDISNYGPRSATGVAEILAKEGEVKFAATGLEFLPNETYQLWLLNQGTGEVFTAGRISPDESGTVNVTNVLPAEIPDRGWSLVFLSVEAPDIVPRIPNSRRSIAGRFPQAAPAGALPAELPKTGGARAVTQRPIDSISYVPVPVQPEPGVPQWTWAAGALGVLVLTGIAFAAGRFSGRGGAS
jgi:hypothetical protein